MHGGVSLFGCTEVNALCTLQFTQQRNPGGEAFSD
jgi:hypothetical protein